MNIAQKIIEAHKLRFGSMPPLQQCSVSGSALFNADCMDILPLIPDKSVQLILADLPYGTTEAKWDSLIDLNKLWIEYKRILSKNGTVVLTSAEPFTSILNVSNLKWFKYDFIWNKLNATGHLNAKARPLKQHENISVFSEGSATSTSLTMCYNPQGLFDVDITKINFETETTGKRQSRAKGKEWKQTKSGYPKSILTFAYDKDKLHPTQKPLELMKYLISTYSNENDMVLDNTMGVGTTCLGAKELNRSFIGIEKEVKYYELAVERVFPITQSIYKNIQTKENYDKLLSSGMFWEFHPELSGNWDVDRYVVQHCH